MASSAEIVGARPPHDSGTLSQHMGPAEYEAALKSDFRLFLYALWMHLLGVPPADIMYDMAVWLQHGPDRSVTEGFRGFSKSWITGGYCLWRLYVNPQEQVLVVSGAATKAKEAVNWCLSLILTWDLLRHLRPRPDQRSSSISFDVGPATPRQAPSFKAIGITGQIVGSRATVIVADDVETQNNSTTPLMRDAIKEAVKEFDSVLIPEPGSCIRYLGTPHDEDSLYNELPKRGYEVRIWPALYPDAERVKRYKGRLAPFVLKRLAELGDEYLGRSTMPSRFSDEDLAKRRLSLGKSTFDLQFMLDTTGADKDKYPLKMRDLVVASLDPRRGPDTIAWSNAFEQRNRDVPNAGFEDDFLYNGIVPENVMRTPWSRVVGAVDPSGRGTDETSLAIVAELHGMLFHLFLWATRDGYGKQTLETIASACVRFGVHTLVVEDNFGDGMFLSLLEPALIEAWRKAKRVDQQGTELVGVKSSNQMAKEKRILAVLEPATQQHRLVIDESVLRWDHDSVEAMEGDDVKHRYSLGHQLSRLTRERDSLVHDDRLEVLSLAVGQFAEVLGVDPQVVAKAAENDRALEEFDRLYRDLDEQLEGWSPGPRDDRAAGMVRSPR